MLTRRGIFGVVVAAVVSPIAVAKGWFEKPDTGIRLPGPDDVISFKSWTGEYEPCCRICGSDPVQEYEIGLEQFNSEPVQPILGNLCDNCAEKQEYLCENRNDFGLHGAMYPCDCGKRGCPGIEDLRKRYREAMKPGPLARWLAKQKDTY